MHVILDNYAAHKYPNVLKRQARRPHFTSHFTPTSASSINAVEGCFASLTKRRLKRGVFHSLVTLQGAFNRLLVKASGYLKPIRWTKELDKSSPRSGAGTKL